MSRRGPRLALNQFLEKVGTLSFVMPRACRGIRAFNRGQRHPYRGKHPRSVERSAPAARGISAPSSSSASLLRDRRRMGWRHQPKKGDPPPPLSRSAAEEEGAEIRIRRSGPLAKYSTWIAKSLYSPNPRRPQQKRPWPPTAQYNKPRQNGTPKKKCLTSIPPQA